MSEKVTTHYVPDQKTKFVVEVWNKGADAIPASGDKPAIPAKPDYLVKTIELDYPDARLVVKEA